MKGESQSPVWFLHRQEKRMRLNPGDHVFYGYSSSDEQREVLGTFLKEGLAQGDTTLHFVVQPRPAGIWHMSGGGGLSGDRGSGQVELVQGHVNTFRGDVRGAEALFGSALEDREGGSGMKPSRIRLVVEMNGPSGVDIPASQVLEFEDSLHRTLLDRKAIALCMYDQRQLGSDLLWDVAHSHPTLLIRGRLYENGHVLWSGKAGEVADAGKLQRFLDEIVECGTAREDARLVRKLPQALIDAVNEPIMIIGSNYEVRLMNRAAHVKYGREGGDFRDHCYRVSHGRERPCEGSDHSCPLRQVLESREAVTVVHEHTAVDGEARTVEIVASPLLDGDDEIVGIVESMWDVTARVRAEQGLRESEARFRSVAQTAADAVIIADVEGNVLFWNRGAAHMFGYEEHEVLRKDWLSLVSESDRVDARAALASSAQVGGSESASRIVSSRTDTLVGKRNGGGEFPISLSASWWRSGGQVFHGLIIRDLTEMRATQERAMAQQRLAAIGQLAAGLAHDFNNILMPVVMYSELLLQEHRVPADSRGMLETVHAEALRASALTDQILDFSRQSVMNMRTMDLSENLKELVGLLRRTLSPNIRIRLAGAEEETYVRADPSRIHQVFLNLALNARDAMPDGGELSFSMTNLQLEAGAPPPFRNISAGKWVQVVVSDTGVGISPEDQPRVFEPFFTTKVPGKGTGLGLSQVYGIIKQHAGYVEIESQKGKGTDIVIYLPKVNRDTDEPAVPQTRIQEGRCESILVVEDNEATLSAVCRILQAMNYSVCSARGGDEALTILRDSAIDLVITDYVMPGLSGMGLVRKLRETRPGVRILVMSGYPLGRGTRELLEGGRLNWIQKPFGTDTLAGKVREALDGPLDS